MWPSTLPRVSKFPRESFLVAVHRQPGHADLVVNQIDRLVAVSAFSRVALTKSLRRASPARPSQGLACCALRSFVSFVDHQPDAVDSARPLTTEEFGSERFIRFAYGTAEETASESLKSMSPS